MARKQAIEYLKMKRRRVLDDEDDEKEEDFLRRPCSTFLQVPTSH
jgi:hypothetical protein